MGLVVIAALIGFAQSASAWPSNGTGGGFWDEAGSWEDGIADGVVLDGDTITVRYLEDTDSIAVESGGTLAVAEDGILEIWGGLNSTHVIDGVVEIGDSNGAGTVVFRGANNHTVTGDGSIKGLNNFSALQILSGKTLTNRMLIEGAMIIEAPSGTCTLINDASHSSYNPVIRANINGTLELASSVILLDDNTDHNPRYEAVDNASARLKFSREHDGNPDSVLEGDFLIDDCADMEFTQNITTNGSLTHTAGSAIIGSGKCFIWGSGQYCTTTGGGGC